MKFLLLAMIPLALATPAIEVFINEATPQPVPISKDIMVDGPPTYFDCIINCGSGGQYVPNCGGRSDHVSMVRRLAGSLELGTFLNSEL